MLEPAALCDNPARRPSGRVAGAIVGQGCQRAGELRWRSGDGAASQYGAGTQHGSEGRRDVPPLWQ
eukprot:150960-Lingulodinium_polyedra.AAC.1